MHTVKTENISELTTTAEAFMIAILAGEVVVGVRWERYVEEGQIKTGEDAGTLLAQPPKPLMKAHMLWIKDDNKCFHLNSNDIQFRTYAIHLNGNN